MNFSEEEPSPIVIKKDPKSMWDDEDADENDVKDSWEDEDEPAPVHSIYCFCCQSITSWSNNCEDNAFAVFSCLPL